MAVKNNTVSILIALSFLAGLIFVSETEAGRRDDKHRRYEKKGRRGPDKTVIIEKNRGQVKRKTVIERSRRKGIVTKKTTVINRGRPGRKHITRHRRGHHHFVEPPVRYRPVKVRGKRYYHRRGRFYSWSPRGYFAIRAPLGAIIVDLPFGYTTLRIGGLRYFHYDGIYYRRHHHGYMVVRPPIGVRLSALPFDAEIVRLHNGTYYSYDGIYYRQVGEHYEICEAPKIISKVEPEPQIVEKRIHTIMVNNSNGSQTPVDLEQIGENQWKGPRGEIYRGWPSQKQLRKAYGF